MYTLTVIYNGRKVELARGSAVELVERILEGWESLYCEEDGDCLDIFAFNFAPRSRSEVFAIEPV